MEDPTFCRTTQIDGLSIFYREAGWSKQGCTSAPYSIKEVRIDGLPLGSRICVRTNRDRYAPVAFEDVVQAKAEKVKAAFITWQEKPDGPTLQNVHQQ
jgi:hypothetical protein